MHQKLYLISFLISGMLHAGVIFSLPHASPVRVQYARGESAVEIMLEPSTPALQKSEEEVIKEPGPLENVPDTERLDEIREEVHSMGRAEKEQELFTEAESSTVLPDSAEELYEPIKKDPAEENTLDESKPEEETDDFEEDDTQPDEPQEEEKEPEEQEDQKDGRPEDAESEHDAPDSPGDVLEEGVERGVEKKNVPRPAYPPVARRRGHEGRVVIRVEVDEKGRAAGTEIVESSGYRSLDEAAVEAAKKATFQPAKQNGREVSSETQISYSFRLRD